MAKCIPCLGTDAKEALRGLGDNKLTKLMDAIADCGGPLEVQLCIKKKRAPSSYNIFIGKCMKEKGENPSLKDAPSRMRKCAAEWKSKQ